MVVIGVVGGADDGGGDAIAEEKREHAVLRRIGVVFVKGEEDESVFVKGRVGQEWGEEG